MKRIVFICLLAIMSTLSWAQSVSLNKDEIRKLKSLIKKDPEVQKQFFSFEKTAQKYLDEAPNPIDMIRSEGLLKGDPLKERTNQSIPDFNKMKILALQYKINNETKYLDKATEFLTAWARINISRGDPIDDTKLDAAFEAFDLIKDDMSSANHDLITKWLTQTADAEINSNFFRKNTAKNNWNAHRLKIVGTIGILLNKKEFIVWSIENLKKHIAINLYADGTSFDFKERDAMHYHIYDLEPMLRLIKVLKRANYENLYAYQSPFGSSIKKSVDWMLPYMKGEKQHEEYVNTTVKFDRERAKNNEIGFAKGTMFKPEMALPVFKLALYFDSSLKNILANINPPEKNWQMVLDEITNS